MSASPKRLLIVNFKINAFPAKLIVDFLNDRGHQTRFLRKDEPVIEVARLYRPDLVLIEVSLATIAAALKANEFTRNIPIYIR